MINNEEKKRERVSQEDMPRSTLREALTIAEALRDSFAAKDASPLSLAKALNRSPKSSDWRYVTGSAVAYGLTNGAYNSSSISLSELGKKITTPLDDEEREEALLEAVRRPTILKAFFEKYDGEKLPKDEIARNVLGSFGVPHDRTKEAWEIVKENARFVNLIEDIAGDPYVVIHPTRTMSYEKPIKPQNNALGASKEIPLRNHQSSSLGELLLIPIVEGQLGVAISQELQNKAWLEKELGKKIQAFIDAGREVEKELKKETNT